MIASDESGSQPIPSLWSAAQSRAPPSCHPLQTNMYQSINDELHTMYGSPNIFRVIKSRRLRSTGHSPRMGEGRSDFKMLTGKSTGMTPLGIDGRTLLE